MRMLVLYKILLTNFFILLALCSFSQQYSRAEIKASYIYNFSKYVEWKAEKDFKVFTIGIYDPDSSIYSILEKSSKYILIKDVPVEIQYFYSVLEIEKTNVLYISEENNYELNKIIKKTTGKSTLIITDNSLLEKSMINFIVEDKAIKFDINEENMAKEELKAMPQLISLFAKTKKELKDLYLKTEELLEIEKSHVKQQKEQIGIQTNKIKEQQINILSHKKEIENQLEKIENQEIKLIDLISEIEKNEKYLEKKITLIKRQEKEILKQQENLSQLMAETKEQQSNINDQKELLSTQKIKIKNQLEQFKNLDQILSKKKKEISVQKQVLSKQLDKIQTQRILIYLSILLILLVLVIVFFIYRDYKTKKIANKHLKEKNNAIELQKEEIETQRDQLENSNSELSDKNAQITDSIVYAERIQKAILPTDNKIKELFPESFIFYKPKDIVSGDFYWVKKINGKQIIVIADCTGHGVPGAFMSLIGSSLLEQIVNEYNIESAATILNHLRPLLIEKISNNSQQMNIYDGIDAAVVIIDYTNSTLNFAGAYNPIYFISENEIQKIKGDRFPIGRHFIKNLPEFSNSIINFKKGDSFYLSTDGYIDQFGGPKNEKFYSSRFKKLLLDMRQKDANQKKEILNNTLINWMGDSNQIDDILVFGAQL